VERVRFEDRLHPTFDVTSDARRALVTTLILQPIVENAVRHGISRRPGSGQIELRAGREGDSLTITVRDDGAGLSGDELVTGTGLRLTEARLRELYGNAATLSVESTAGHHGVTVRIAIPFHTAPLH
jgi:LytS/YehU family sensor histidine kinase